MTGPDHWKSLQDLPFEGLGIDWHPHLAQTLVEWGNRWAIQGNIDPDWLFLDSSELETRLRRVWGEAKKLPVSSRQGWVCGLGHGILPKTPEENVHLFIQVQKELFG